MWRIIAQNNTVFTQFYLLLFGEMNLFLIGSLDDYEISLDKGVGNALIDGYDMKDNDTYGTGINKIDIDGGIGNINIDFESLRR